MCVPVHYGVRGPTIFISSILSLSTASASLWLTKKSAAGLRGTHELGPKRKYDLFIFQFEGKWWIHLLKRLTQYRVYARYPS
jgi:hypothetical protein